jgi:hypothetical protein
LAAPATGAAHATATRAAPPISRLSDPTE